jgi:hypothetical protein
MPAMLRATRDPLPDLREHGVPPAFAAVIEKACAKNTRDRYQSAAEFGAALQAIQPELGDSVTPMQTTEVPVLAAPLAAGDVAPPLDATTPQAAHPELLGDDAPAPASPDAAPDVTTADPVSSPPPTIVAPPVAPPPAGGPPAGGPPAAGGSPVSAHPPKVPATAGDGMKPGAMSRLGQSDGVSKSVLAIAVVAVLVLVLVAVFFIRRGDNDKLETKDGSSTTEQSTTPSTEASTTGSTASSTTASSTESTTTSSTTAPPPPGPDAQEIAEAKAAAEANYPGFTVSDTSGWRGKQGVSSVIAEDSEGREKIVVFIDGAFVGNDYTLPSYNLTMVAADANGFTVDYDLFNAGEDDHCCAPVGQLRVRFERSGGGATPLSPDRKSAPADRNVPNHR